MAAAIFAGAWAPDLFLCTQNNAAGVQIPLEESGTFHPFTIATGPICIGDQGEHQNWRCYVRYADFSSVEPGTTGVGIYFIYHLLVFVF